MSHETDSVTAFWCGVIASTVGWVVVLVTVSIFDTVNWRRKAIEHGAAEYDQKTGAFQWKAKVQDE